MAVHVGLPPRAIVWLSLASAAGCFRGAGARDAAPRADPDRRFLGLESKRTGHLLAQQPLPGDDTVVSTEYESWFGRLRESIAQVLMGWVAVVFSIPLLWFSERRTAQMESLILTGEAACLTVSGKAASEENRGRLVHIANEPTQSMDKVSDRQFQVAFTSDCVRLRSEVQIFQNIQHERKVQRERLGGGRETVTEYTYTQEWRDQFHDGLQNRRYKNTRPPGIQLGAVTRSCGRVALGGGFELTDALVAQCDSFRSAADRIGGSVEHGSGYTFHRGGDSYFYFRKDRAGWKGDGRPAVGDVRVKFEYVPDGLASVVALQAKSAKAGGGRDSFLPYRTISRGWFGVPEEQEKQLLAEQGKKRPEVLAAEDSMGGCLSVCCCACSLVAACFSAVLTPEIYHLWERDVDKAACFQNLRDRSGLMAWIVRFLGWALLFAGFYATFSPIQTLLTVIPFLGPYLASFADMLIWVFCLMVTLVVAALIICLAYLRYRPLTALLYLAAAGLVVAATIAASKAFGHAAAM